MAQHCVFSSPWWAARSWRRPSTYTLLPKRPHHPTPFSHVPATSTRDALPIQQEYPMAQMKYTGGTMMISFDGHQVLAS